MQATHRYVIFVFLALGLVLWTTLARLLAAVAYSADISDPPVLGANFTATTLASLLIAVGAVVFAVKSQKVFGFSTDVAAELRQVTWPAKKEAKTATWVVIITTLIISFLLGVFDFVWAKVTGLIYTN